MKPYLKTMMAFLLCCFSCLSYAVNYYIDPSADKAPGKGTKESPWNDLHELNAMMKKLLAGDTVFFYRGQIYSTKLLITCSGTPASPIVFTTYGQAKSNPVFVYKKQSEDPHYMVEIRKAAHVVIDGLDISDDNMGIADEWMLSRIKIGFAINESHFIQIRNLRGSRVGIGVNIVGNDNQVINCRFENLRMVRNTKGGNDDYGANPVVIAGARNTVANCIFKHCKALSYDYGFDGGAIEMFGPACSNNRIYRNLAFDCNGFMEFGSSEGGESSGNRAEENTIINCGDLVYINNGGEYALRVKELSFINNRIIQTVSGQGASKNMIKMTRSSNDPLVITLHGNVFWLGTTVNLLKESLFTPGQVSHRNNIFYLSGGKLNMDPDTSDKIFTSEQGNWKEKPLAEIIKINSALYPFKYLLNYWFLFI